MDYEANAKENICTEERIATEESVCKFLFLCQVMTMNYKFINFYLLFPLYTYVLTFMQYFHVSLNARVVLLISILHLHHRHQQHTVVYYFFFFFFLVFYFCIPLFQFTSAGVASSLTYET